MVDTVQLAIARLNDSDSYNPVILTLAGGEVYGETLAEGFDPSGGKCAVVVASRGGNAHPEILDLASDRVQVTCWAGRNCQQAAKTLYLAVREWMHGAQNISGMKSCLEVVAGQSLADPDTGWAMVTAFYLIIAAGTSDEFTNPSTPSSNDTLDGGAF